MTNGLVALENETFFGRSKILLNAIMLVMFALGLGIRLFDLTDPPLDFHPTRQLRSAIIARSLYYRSLPEDLGWQRERAIEQYSVETVIEPLVFESIVSFTYRLAGSEQLWIARVYASVFWILGGIALYLLARGLTSVDGAVLAAAYYLFVPFGITASRSFQPDPLMVMLLLVALWRIYIWHTNPSWGRAVTAGLLAGLAVFVKAVAVFPVVFGVGGLILFTSGFRKAVANPQVWMVALLTALPAVVYHFYGVYVLGTLGSQFEGRVFPELWSDPKFYVNWVDTASGLLGFSSILAGLLGAMLFAAPGARALGLGLWLGYFAYGMTFNYHITTHSYYHLPLVAILALTLAPIGTYLFRPLAKLKPGWLVQGVVTGLLFSAILIILWDVRVGMVQEDYRHEPAYWRELGEILGPESAVIGLTHDYGNRLAYYGWITPQIWLPTGHLNYRELKGKPPIAVQHWFESKAGNMDYFLVTLINQLNKQPDLKELLYNNFPVIREGEGYVIFDLKNPLK